MDSSKLSGPSFEMGSLRGGTFASPAAPAPLPTVHPQQSASHSQAMPPAPPIPAIIRGDGLFTVLWRGKFLILAAIVLSFGAAFGYLRLQPRTYTASAKIMMTLPGAALGPGTDDNSSLAADRATQCALIESVPVIESALKSPSLSKVKLPASHQSAVQWVKRGLIAEMDRMDDLITVSFTASNPNDAADIVNEVIESYSSFDVQTTAEEASDKLKVLRAEQTRQQATLVQQARDIHDYKEANRTLQFSPGEPNTVLSRVAKLSDQVAQAQLEVADAKAVANANQSAATQRAFELALSKEQILESELKEQQSLAMALDAKTAEYDRLESEYRRTQQILDVLDKRIREIAIGGSRGAISVRVLEPADALLVGPDVVCADQRAIRHLLHGVGGPAGAAADTDPACGYLSRSPLPTR